MTYCDKVYTTFYTNFHGLNMLEDDRECESSTAVSTDSLLVYKNNVIWKYAWVIVLISQAIDKLFWWKYFWNFGKLGFIMIELQKGKELMLLKVLTPNNLWCVTVIF